MALPDSGGCSSAAPLAHHHLCC